MWNRVGPFLWLGMGYQDLLFDLLIVAACRFCLLCPCGVGLAAEDL